MNTPSPSRIRRLDHSRHRPPSLNHTALGEPVSSGVAGLDVLLGGGYRRGSCTLIAGDFGHGKTTFAATFTRNATANGERVFYLNFEESVDAMLSCMLSPGIDLRRR
jgi:circadian clock protein KaiC